MAFYRFPQISLCSNTYKSMVQRKGTNGPLSTEHVFCPSVDSDQSSERPSMYLSRSPLDLSLVTGLTS